MSSNEKKDVHHYDPFQGFNRSSTFPFFDDNINISSSSSSSSSLNYNNQLSGAAASTQSFQAFDPAAACFMSFTDCLHGDYSSFSRAFDMSCSSPDVLSPIDDYSNSKRIGSSSTATTTRQYHHDPAAPDNSVGNTAVTENPSTPNSSLSSSSNEEGGGADEGSSKGKKDHKQQPPKDHDDDIDHDDKSKKV